MTYQIEKLQQFVSLVAQHAPEEGINLSAIPDFGTFKASTTQVRNPVIDAAAFFIVGQGRKNCYVGDKVFDYSPGKALVMFYPLAVEVEFVEASPDRPFWAADGT